MSLNSILFFHFLEQLLSSTAMLRGQRGKLGLEANSFRVISLRMVMVDYIPLLFLYPQFTKGKEQSFLCCFFNVIVLIGPSRDPGMLEIAGSLASCHKESSLLYTGQAVSLALQGRPPQLVGGQAISNK